jgi:hypothetical protein
LAKYNIPQQQIEQACRFKFHKNSSMISACYAVSDLLKQIRKLLASATSRNKVLEGTTKHWVEIEPVVKGRIPLIEKRKQQIFEKGKRKRKRNNLKILIVIISK